MPSWLAPFDPNATFIVRRIALMAARKKYLRGDVFDNSSVTERTLRQLYQARAISYPDVGGAPAKSMIAERPDVETVEDDGETVASLVGANTKKDLIDIAEGLRMPDGSRLTVDRSMTKAILAGQIVKARADGAT